MINTCMMGPRHCADLPNPVWHFVCELVVDALWYLTEEHVEDEGFGVGLVGEVEGVFWGG